MSKGLTPIVVDASVAIKWFLADEDGTTQALDILKRFSQRKLNLISPTLFPFEVINGLIVASLRKRIVKEQVLLAIQQFLALAVPQASVDLTGAALLALETDLSLYDASYLELALRHKMQFVTSDRRLYERGKKVHSRVLLLSKWKG